MAAVNILALGLLVLSLSLYWKEEIVDVLPMAACLLILFLYPLALIRRLSGADIAGILFLLGWTVWAVRLGKEKRRLLWKEIRLRLGHPGALAAVLLLAGTAFLVRGRIAVWWDDVNFWAADAKSLYFLDGFASKYTNAASEFGDYPPGLQLLKWWFLHFSPERFSEGLMFAGYYFGVFVFLMPLLRRLRGRTAVTGLALAGGAAVWLWVFPSAAEVFYCQGMCADLVMAAIYGAFLAAAADEDGHKKGFYALRLTLYLAVLVMIKSVGFLWAGFGLVFLCGYRLTTGRRSLWKQIPLLILPACTGGSWLLYCLKMRRVAKLTGAAVSAASGHLPILLEETRHQLLSAFREAFISWPLHQDRTWGLDLSPLMMLLLLWAAALIIWRTGMIRKGAGPFLFLFVPVSGLLFYAIDLVSHLTIFAGETQYLDPYAMVCSQERYGVPFTVGTLYLLAFLLLERAAGAGRTVTAAEGTGAAGPAAGIKAAGAEKSAAAEGTATEKPAAGVRAVRRVYLGLFLFAAVCANWSQVYHALFGYWAEREEMLAGRAELTAADGPLLEMLEDMRQPEMTALFFEEDRGILKPSGQGENVFGIRVVCVRNAEDNAWVNNAYTAYEASPVSLLFAGVDASYMGKEEAASFIQATHAGYFYADPLTEENEALFAGMTEAFSPGVLYRIETEENGALRLVETGISAAPQGGKEGPSEA